MDRNNEPLGTGQPTSEVHTRLNVEPSKGEGMSGSYDASGAGTMDRAKGRVQDARDEVKHRADEVRGRAQDRMEDARDEVERMAGKAKSRANEMLDETGARRRIDDHPMLALGAAFGIGFLLAGSSEDKGGMRGKVRSQLRAAIMGGMSAAAAQQARSMFGMDGGAGGLGDLLDSAFGSRGSAGTARAGSARREPTSYGA